MSVATVAEDKATGKDAKVGFTTFRIYEADGEDLSDLAKLENKTAADVFRDLCAPLIRKLLKERMEERLKKLSRKPTG